jgi:predicted RNase H-like nuclease (RuvC/YqgF family)
MSKELLDVLQVVIPGLLASIPGFAALYIAVRKTPHETEQTDAETSVTYLGTAKTAEELVGIKDTRIKKLENKVRELELENERQRKEISALKEELEIYCHSSSEVKTKSKMRSK